LYSFLAEIPSNGVNVELKLAPIGPILEGQRLQVGFWRSFLAVTLFAVPTMVTRHNSLQFTNAPFVL
jgi:hypothetical protein